MRDPVGLIDETHFSLRYPRPLDETNRDIDSITIDALRLIRDGAEKVAVYTVRPADGEGVPREGDLLFTIEAAVDAEELLAKLEHP